MCNRGIWNMAVQHRALAFCGPKVLKSTAGWRESSWRAVHCPSVAYEPHTLQGSSGKRYIYTGKWRLGLFVRLLIVKASVSLTATANCGPLWGKMMDAEDFVDIRKASLNMHNIQKSRMHIVNRRLYQAGKSTGSCRGWYCTVCDHFTGNTLPRSNRKATPCTYLVRDKINSLCFLPE